MLKKRIIITLCLKDGVLFRTKKFQPDYRYTKNFVDLWHLDELILIDISKKKFQKNFINNIKKFSKNFLVPLTVGGGIKKLEHVQTMMDAGADKVVVSTGAFENKKLLDQISKNYGSQAIISSIDCKRVNDKYLLMKNHGKELVKEKPLDWAKHCINSGAGELLINNIDFDGSLLGFDLKLVKLFSKNVNLPIIALGGAGNWEHILELFNKTNISGACTQNIYHFTNQSLLSLKDFLKKNKINIRN